MEISYNQEQFYLIITLILWLFFVSEYIMNRKTQNAIMLSIVQFFLSFPFIIAIAVISFNFAFGYAIVFLIPILSLYLLIDGLIYSHKAKKEKQTKG